MSTATPRPWLTLLLLAFTALLWSLPSFAAVPPKCTINGATGSTAYTDYILPPLVAWDAPSGSGAPGNSRFATPGDAGLVYFQYRMDHDTMPNTCQYGCTLDIQRSSYNSYDWMEEYRNIKETEARVATNLGESVRTNHRGENFTACSSISTMECK